MPVDCRTFEKTAAEQGSERMPNGTYEALPPPPPKPQSNEKGGSGSRVHDDVAGKSLCTHAMNGLLLCLAVVLCFLPAFISLGQVLLVS